MTEQTEKAPTKTEKGSKNPSEVEPITTYLQEKNTGNKTPEPSLQKADSQEITKVIPVENLRDNSNLIVSYSDPVPVYFRNFDLYLPHYEELFNILQFYLTPDLPPMLLGDESQSNSALALNLFRKIIFSINPGNAVNHFLKLYVEMKHFNLWTVNLLEIYANPHEKIDAFDREMQNLLKKPRLEVTPTLILLPFYRYESMFSGITQTTIDGKSIISAEMIHRRIAEIINKTSIIDSPHLLIVINSLTQHLHETSGLHFDFEVSVGNPDQVVRTKFLKNWLENIKINNIDYDHISLQMEGWAIINIRRFITYFVIKNSKKEPNHQPKLDMGDMIQEVKKYNVKVMREKKPDSGGEESRLLKHSISLENPVSEDHLSGSLEGQLYIDLSYKHYDEMSIILDKQMKGLILNPLERKILAQNSFVLHSDPKSALRKLHKAKTKLSKITHIIPLKKNSSTSQ